MFSGTMRYWTWVWSRGGVCGGKLYLSWSSPHVGGRSWCGGLIQSRLMIELYQLWLGSVACDGRLGNGSVTLVRVVPFRMLYHITWGSGTNDVNGITPEQQLVVERVQRDETPTILGPVEFSPYSVQRKANNFSPKHTTAFWTVHPCTQYTVTP